MLKKIREEIRIMAVNKFHGIIQVLVVLLALLACGLVVPGCGESSGGRIKVFGTVTLDGQPLEEGTLFLVPAEGTRGPTAGAKISNGRYEIPAAAGPIRGTFKVQIVSRRKTGKTVAALDGPQADSVAVEQTQQIIPARYNTQSELMVRIDPENNHHNFELRGNP